MSPRLLAWLAPLHDETGANWQDMRAATYHNLPVDVDVTARIPADVARWLRGLAPGVPAATLARVVVDDFAWRLRDHEVALREDEGGNADELAEAIGFRLFDDAAGLLSVQAKTVELGAVAARVLCDYAARCQAGEMTPRLEGYRSELAPDREALATG